MTGPVATAPAGSTLHDVATLLARQGLHLLRSWPRDENHLLLEAGRDGAVVAGQWFATAERAAEVARKTPGAEQLGRVVLQPHGADRKLPGLVPLLRRDGAELVAHRPERRAVVRLPAGSPHAVEYAKVVRPGVLADVARTTAAAAALPLRTPAVVGVDDATSAVITAALPGRTLHDLLATPDAFGRLPGRRAGPGSAAPDARAGRAAPARRRGRAGGRPPLAAPGGGARAAARVPRARRRPRRGRGGRRQDGPRLCCTGTSTTSRWSSTTTAPWACSTST